MENIKRINKKTDKKLGSIEFPDNLTDTNFYRISSINNL